MYAKSNQLEKTSSRKYHPRRPLVRRENLGRQKNGLIEGREVDGGAPSNIHRARVAMIPGTCLQGGNCHTGKRTYYVRRGAKRGGVKKRNLKNIGDNDTDTQGQTQSNGGGWKENISRKGINM